MAIETKVTDNLQLFQKRLKKLRGEKSLQEVSQDLGISRATLGYYENGDRKPDIEVLIKIADYYKVSSDYLLGLSDFQSSDVNIQTASKVTGLNEKTIEKLYNYAHSKGYCHYDSKLILNTLDCLIYSSKRILPQISAYLHNNFDCIAAINHYTDEVTGDDIDEIVGDEVPLDSLALLDNENALLARINTESFYSLFLVLIQNELMDLREHIKKQDDAS